MLHGILEYNGHGFFHGIRGAMSVELTRYYSPLLVSGISLGFMQFVLLSFLNPAFIIVAF
jgi:hypothetical protein